MSNPGSAASGILANAPTIVAPPSTASVANQILATMAALTGVLTDYNPGSQIRTIAESVGSVNEMQGVWSTTLAFQTLVYSALSLFRITPVIGSFASGTVTFATSFASPAPVASQNVPIPLGTIVQTPGGVQFQTMSGVVLVSGTSAIDAPVSALVAGAGGNVTPNSINQVITGLNYPVACNNYSGTAGGASPQSTQVALGQFAATVGSIGLSSPQAIANATVGVSFGGQSVVYGGVFEPWIFAGGASGSGQAGYTVLIDNGSGSASSGLINAVTNVLLGGTNSSGISNASGAPGYHDTGVPFTVVAPGPTYAVVGVTGTAIPGYTDSQISGAVAAAVNNYFTLQYGVTAYQAQLAATISDAALGQLSALTVALYLSGSSVAVTGITPPPSGRVVLAALNQTLN